MPTSAFPTPAHFLKAIGQKPRIPLDQIDNANASIDPDELEPFQNASCLTPNFGDPELAAATVAELENVFQVGTQTCTHIKAMHERASGKALGKGGWPGGKKCHPNDYPHEGYHAVKIYSDHDDFMANSSLDREVKDSEWQNVIIDGKIWPTLEKPVLSVAEAKQIFIYEDSELGNLMAKRVNKKIGETLNVLDMGHWLAFESLRRFGIFAIEMFDGPDGDHGIHMITYKMPGSLAGLGYYPDATCDDHVTSAVDSLIEYGLGWFTGLTTHELGHTIGLKHEFRNPQSVHRSIMSYSQDNSPYQGFRKKGSPYQYVEDHSWPEGRVLYGGEAALPIEQVVTPPTTGKTLILDPLLVEYESSGAPIITNEFEVEGRKFIIVPRPVF